MEKINKIWSYLLEYSVATEEELQLITSINGFSENTLNEVIYARTGYRSFEQLQESEV